MRNSFDSAGIEHCKNFILLGAVGCHKYPLSGICVFGKYHQNAGVGQTFIATISSVKYHYEI
jgi:hypothetical protein